MQTALWIDTPALGDTIAAIPTLRKISEACDNQPITVFTTKPFLFENHPLVKEVFKSDADKSDYKVYRVFSPLVGKTYDLNGEKVEFRYSNMDLRQFHAVSLGFTLTEAEMDMDLYIERERELPVKDYVIIHPTHTWPTRTWEQEKWQELIDRLNDQGIPVVAVGRDAKEVGFFNTDKPVMPINIRYGVNLLNDDANDPAELRWMMNHRARAVVTMDSGILHVAGTTDVNIIQLGSSIDNKLRAPYRNGSQDYKYNFVRGGCGEFCSSSMKYNIKVHGNIHGIPPQVKCLADKPTFECHPSVDQVFDATLQLYSSSDLKHTDRVYVTHCDEAYAPIANKMIETVKEFSNIPVVAYVINSDVKLPAADKTIRLDFDIRDGDQFIQVDGNTYVDRASSKVFDIITKKPNVIKHALENIADHVVYLDGDTIATHRIDGLFDYTNEVHPMMTQGGEEFMMFNGNGSPFIHKEGEPELRDLNLTLEVPACKLFNVDIQNRNYYQAYVQTGYISAIKSNVPFINEWIDMCEHPAVVNNTALYAPYHEETLVNVLLWKYNYRDRMPLVYVNANSIDRIDDTYTFSFNGESVIRRGPWFFTPGNVEDIKVFHGEKRPEVVDQMVQHLKENYGPNSKKMKIAFIAPHLSTGGMPEFLLTRLKALYGDETLELHVIEYCLYATTYTVQRNQILTMLGDNFHEIGHLGTMEQEEREARLKAILESISPDIIHIEECPESFDGFNQMSRETQAWIYSNSKPWKVVETCHNIWFDPRSAKRYSPDAYALCSPHHMLETFSEEPSEKQEVHFPIISHKRSETERRKSLEIFGMENLSDCYHIVNIGLWTPGKNQAEALAWATHLQALSPGKYHFHFVGNQASNFEEYWGPLMRNYPRNVHIHGERSDIHTYYQMADAIAFNSTWECNPLALRQSIGWDIPVMARNLPQYHGMYSEYVTGIVGNTAEDCSNLQRALETKVERNIQDSMARFKKDHINLYKKALDRKEPRKSNSTAEWTIKWDNGPRVTSHTGRDLFVEFLADGETVYSHTLQGDGYWCKPAVEWYRDWTVVVDGIEHKLDLKDRVATVRFNSSSLGDTLSWVEAVREFRFKKGLTKVYLATYKNWLFDQDWYRTQGIEFIAPGEEREDSVADFAIGVYMEDPPGTPWFPNRNKRDWRKIYLGDIATDQLGLASVKKAPKLAYTEKHQQDRPYICIATQSTAQAKYWNNPTGWQELVDHYNAKGYDVYHMSKEGTELKGIIQAPEDMDKTYALINGAELFVGISSGLSWLAWCTETPVVLISGFTPEECEYQNERTLRIIDKEVCNGCWAWDHFNRGDWNWCPTGKGNDRHFECTKVLTGERVINMINEWKEAYETIES